MESPSIGSNTSAMPNTRLDLAIERDTVSSGGLMRQARQNSFETMMTAIAIVVATTGGAMAQQRILISSDWGTVSRILSTAKRPGHWSGNCR